MKRNIIRNFFGVVLVLIIITSIFLVYKNIDEKEIQLDNVSLNEIDEYSGIALMLEQSVGKYEKSDSNDWPRKGYKLNQRLSGCVDESGNTIEKALTFEYGTLKVKTRVNASCYLYFDKRKTATEELIATVPEEQLWDSTLEDDGYRYVGTNPDNYICFGTDSISECTSDTDKYMYRIIGIFEDEEGKQHLKLIKKEALNTEYAWHSDASTDTDWDESDLYKGINGSYFATNSEYSYMQDTNWINKISEWEYTATNTKSYENYKTTGTTYGPNYYYQVVRTTYLHEMNRSSKANCYYNASTTADCNIEGSWKTVKGKISLMYVSDYQLSLGSTALDYTNNTSAHYQSMKTGWMHISNNDSGAPSSYEWTSSRYGGGYGDDSAWRVGSTGYVSNYFVNGKVSVRPVFYLEADIELKEGLGTIKEPYIINNDTATEEIIGTAGSDLWDSTLEDDGYRYVGTNPDNYICFGTTSQEECMNDTDKYMYRIIGIFEDEEGNHHLKLIKKEALNTAYAWHINYSTDTDWDESDLYKGINGSYFATNSEYSYMQDSTWINKIDEWEYTATNTKTYENYENSIYGPFYYYNTGRTIYLHEMNRTGKSSQTCYNENSIVDCNIGEWKTVSSKISLMYVSDYLLSLGNSSLDYTSVNNYNTLKTSWMNITNNDINSETEWTMTKLGKYNNTVGYDAYGTYSIGRIGNIGNGWFTDQTSVRPVFYLTSDTQLSKGTGTSSDPYTIKPAKVEQTDTEKLIENVSSDVLWKSTLEDDGYRYVGTNPNNYVCFGYDNVEEDCDFANATNTDLYAYRIIGIFEDEEGQQHLKLIKKEALNTSYQWNTNYQNDVDWDASDLYKGLNGSYFATNPNYSYMQDSAWNNLITTWEYTATNTKTVENYVYNSRPYGIHYRYSTVKSNYLHEMNQIEKLNVTCNYNGNTLADCSVGEWKTVKSKIGIIYVTDYMLSLGISSLTFVNNSAFQTMKTGWIHLSKNDTAPPNNTYEWTMTRYGKSGSSYYAWYVDSTGLAYNYWVDYAYSVRPTFYLTSDVKISGEGTIGSPYIIN